MNNRLEAAQRYQSALERFLDTRTTSAERPRVSDLAVMRGELAFGEGLGADDDFFPAVVFELASRGGAHSAPRSNVNRIVSAAPPLRPHVPPFIPREDDLLAQLNRDELLALGHDFEPISALDERWRAFVSMASAVGGDISLVDDLRQRETAMTTAWDLLCHRHDLTARVIGLSRWAIRTPHGAQMLLKPLVAASEEIIARDRAWRRHIDCFVPLNPRRRVERARYDTPIDLWWWNERADCDWPAVYAAADGRAEPTPHIDTCEHCRALLHDLRGVGRALAAVRHEYARHLTAEQLVQTADGDAPDTLRREADAHLRLCTACRSDLDGLRRSGRGGAHGSH